MNALKNVILVMVSAILILAPAIFAYANPAIVNLGEAGNFAILSKTAISDVPLSAITGDVGISPAAATFITGLTCPEVNGTGVPFPIHVPSAGGGTLACQTVDPGYLTPTIGEMQAAYTDALSRASDVTMGADIGGQTLTPGVYTTAFNLGISSNLYLNCGGNTKGVFIFRIAGNLDLSSSTNVVLQGGCQASRIFWAVAGTTTINGGVGTESIFYGTVLGGPATSEITVITGSTVNGRLLGEKTIAIQKNTITMTADAPDNTAPTITLNTANNTWTSNNQSSLNFTFADNVSVNASCSLFIDGAAYNSSMSVNNGTSALITPNATLSEGAHTWYVNCTDLSANEGTSAPRVFNIDKTAPVVAITSPAGNSTNNSRTLSVAVTLAEANLDASVSNLTAINSSGAVVNYTALNGSGTYALTVPADGTYNITALAVDKAGLSATSTNSNITITTNDAVAPTLEVSTISNAAAPNVSFAVNADGTGSAIGYVSLNIYDNANTLVSSLVYNTTSAVNTANCSVVGITNVTCSANPYIGGGNFLLNATVRDAFGLSNYSAQYFNLTTTIGDASSINTNMTNVSVTINGTNATNGMQLAGANSVNITSNGLPAVYFSYNFTQSALNFSALNISSGTGSGASFFVVNGVNLSGAQVGGKTFYVYNVSTGFNGICVQNVESATVPSASCTGIMEFALMCNGFTNSQGVTCTKSSGGTILTISGLQNSGINQYNLTIVSPAAVDLGTAGNFVALAKTAITTTGTTAIAGDIGISPAAASYITGFGLIMDSSNQFSTSSLVNGRIYAADYANPTPSDMTTAISNMETAYADAAGRTNPDFTELGAGNIGGMTLAAGLYKWGTGVTIPTDVTLSGNSSDVWIFQVAQTLDIANGKQIILSGGADAKNIFWQVAGQTTVGTTAVFNGIILDQTAIVINTGATLNGRALAQTAVTMDGNSVNSPMALNGTSPVVALDSPQANFNTTNPAITFNFTARDDLSATMNCSLFINGILNATNSSTANNTATNFTVPGFSDGTRTWSVNCTDGSNLTGHSAVRNYSVDTANPGLTVSAISNAASSNVSFTADANGTGTAISYVSLNIYDNTGALVSSLIYNTTSGANTANCSVVGITNVTCSANPHIGGGNFMLNATAHDMVGLANSSTQYFNLTTTIGDASNIITNMANVSVTINGTNATGGMQLAGANSVNVTSNGVLALNFSYNFTQSALNFSKLNISSGTSAGAAYIVINGVNTTGAQVGANTAYLYNVSTAYDAICVQNAANAGIPSASCTGTGEYYLLCNGAVDSHGVACTKSSGNTQLTIAGLQSNAGIIQFDVPSSPAPSPTPSGGSGSGGSGGGSGGSGSGSSSSGAVVTTVTVPEAAAPVAPIAPIEQPSPAPSSKPAQNATLPIAKAKAISIPAPAEKSAVPVRAYTAAALVPNGPIETAMNFFISNYGILLLGLLAVVLVLSQIVITRAKTGHPD